MSEDPGGRGVKGLGALGVLAAIISIWWFALRPRRKGDGESEG